MCVRARKGVYAAGVNCVTGVEFSATPDMENRPIFCVRRPVTALKEKMEIPSSSSLASKWCMSPPINHRAAQTDS